MKFLLLLGLKLTAGAAPFEDAADSREFPFTLEDPAVVVEPIVVEDAWRPFPHLRYEDWGAYSAEDRRWLAPAAESRGEPFDWRSVHIPAAQKYGQFDVLLEPLDALVAEHLRGTWDRGASEASVSTDLSAWVNSLGAPLGGSIFLGLRIDLISYEESDGRRLPLIDPRHGAPRPNYVSTGVGLTLGF
jgi:hypothetical protein